MFLQYFVISFQGPYTFPQMHRNNICEAIIKTQFPKGFSSFPSALVQKKKKSTA